MGIGLIVLPKAGSVTAPTSLALTLPSAETNAADQEAGMSVVYLPAHHGVIYGNGFDSVRHVIGGSELRTGGLAPKSAMTATPSGAQATALLDLDVAGDGTSVYDPSDGDSIKIVGSATGFIITAKTTLIAPTVSPQVLATDGETFLDSLQDLINNVNENITWVDVSPNLGQMANVRANVEIVSHPTTYQLNLRIKDYGTSGNSHRAYLNVGTWTDCDFEASGVSGTAVGTTNYFQNGTDGTDGDTPPPASGSYKYVQANFRDVDGALTGASPVSSEARQGVAQDIDITGLSDNADTTFDYIRWFRTLTEGPVFFKGADVAAGGAGTDTDTFTDTELNDRFFAGAETYNEREHRAYAAGFPPRYMWLAYHNGSVFGYGADISADYAIGTAAVTAGSDSVTLSAAAIPTEEMVGREYQTDSTSERYLILAVNEATRVLTINRNYTGATNATAGYKIIDTRNPYEFGWAVPGFPNQWPVTQTEQGITSDSDYGPTGVVPMWGGLVAFTIDGVWAITGKVPPYSINLMDGSTGKGSVSGRAVEKVGSALYWMGRHDIFGMGPDGNPSNLSNPKVEGGVVRGIRDTMKRINELHRKDIHSLYDPDTETVRWFVPLDDDVTCRHVIVYSLQTGAFWLETCEDITCAKIVTDAGGCRHVLYGDVSGHIYEMELSNSDGAYGFEPKTTCTAGTTKTWTDSNASFPTSGDGLKGIPFILVDDDGDFVRAKIATNTSTLLTFDRHLSSAPEVGDQGYVGGILHDKYTGRFDLGDNNGEKTIQKLILSHSHESTGEYFVAVAADQDALALPQTGNTSGLLSETSGENEFDLNSTGRNHQIQIIGAQPGCDPTFKRIEFQLNGEAKPRVGV